MKGKGKKKVWVGWIPKDQKFQWDGHDSPHEELRFPEVYKTHDPLMKEKKIRITVEEIS